MKLKGKKYVFESEGKREIAVCVAIQKIGLATAQEMIRWITVKGGSVTEKQVVKCAENLRRRDMLSIDLTLKDDEGIPVKRYGMKKINLAVPEIAQIKDLVDDASLKPLIDELDRSKGTRKKGMKNFDYYVAEVEFKTRGGVQGFVPDSQGIIRHYRRDNKPVLYQYHFKNWFRDNLPLINRVSSAIGDIKFHGGEIRPNGEMKIAEQQSIEPQSADKLRNVIPRYISNINPLFNSSHGTGGRGVKYVECLPEGSLVTTRFAIPRELLPPNKLEWALKIFGEYGPFGGCAKLSTGYLDVTRVTIIINEIFPEN